MTKITPETSKGVSSAHEKPEVVPSCEEEKLFTRAELLNALSSAFVAGRSKQTFESFRKEWIEIYHKEKF